MGRLAVVMAVVTLAGALLVATGAATVRSASPPERPWFRLFAWSGSNPPSLTALDPETLATVGDASAADLALFHGLRSADGSTAVPTHPSRVVTVLDGRTGAERTTFEPPLLTGLVALSRDGTRLVMALAGSRIDPPRSRWYVFDTADGSLLSTVELEGFGQEQRWVDPDARRVYRVFRPPRRPAELAGHDLTTGAELGRLELSDPLAGPNPTVVMSPDGRHLALVRAAGDAVAVVDTERLGVERVVSLDRPASLWDRLPLAVRVAEAKEEPSRGLHHAVVGVDGRTLYVWRQDLPTFAGSGHGAAGSSASGQYCTSCHGPRAGRPPPSLHGPAAVAPAPQIGLVRADLLGGRAHVRALVGESIRHVEPAPDGRSLYVSTEGETLWRLDAVTLDVLAARELPRLQRTAAVPGRVGEG
jgi:hypothetical protein